MAEFRWDVLRENWVIIAPERAGRPHQIREERQLPEGFDPFAEGEESRTPRESYALRSTHSNVDGPGWRVRAFPNLYPAVTPQIPSGGEPRNWGFSESAAGVHEVIVDCPRGETRFSRLTLAEIRDVLICYRERVRALSQDERWRYVSIFKNEGLRAGASIAHCHSQLIALPWVPPQILQEWTIQQAYEERGGRSFWDDLEQFEGHSPRMIQRRAGFLAFCPYASRFAFESWILPNAEIGQFQNLTDEQLENLAGVLRRLLCGMDQVAHQPDYNLTLQLPELRAPGKGAPRWQLRILPRLNGVAGFEWSTGVFVNTTEPEAAARQLRGAAGAE